MSLFGNFVILKAVRMEVLKKTRSFVLSRKAGEVFKRNAEHHTPLFLDNKEKWNFPM